MGAPQICTRLYYETRQARLGLTHTHGKADVPSGKIAFSTTRSFTCTSHMSLSIPRGHDCQHGRRPWLG